MFAYFPPLIEAQKVYVERLKEPKHLIFQVLKISFLLFSSLLFHHVNIYVLHRFSVNIRFLEGKDCFKMRKFSIILTIIFWPVKRVKSLLSLYEVALKILLEAPLKVLKFVIQPKGPTKTLKGDIML